MSADYTILECGQRSAEWFQARLGRLTGSNADKAIAFKKNGEETAERIKLRDQLVAERLTGLSADADQFVSKEMERGMWLEGAAAAAYEAAKTDAGLVRWSGFLSHNTLMSGCSLDGHIGDPLVGIIELKCPKSATHVAYRRRGGVPEEYETQILHNLWISGAHWLDFVSFDDRFPEALELYVYRQYRDEIAINAYADRALNFLRSVDRDYALITGTAWTQAADALGVR